MVAKEPSTDSFAAARSELCRNCFLSSYRGSGFDGVSNCVIIVLINLDHKCINLRYVLLTEVARDVFSASEQVTVEATEVIFVVRVVTCNSYIKSVAL